MREIEVAKLSLDAVELWANQWLVLTAGTLADCNMMTVSWGSIGYMWSKPFAQVLARPQRHTRKYLEEAESFTLCAFSENHREELRTLGTLSGKDGPKLAKTGLTLRASTRVAAPAYQEASLILECRKIYVQDLDPAGFTDKAILQECYPAKDYHRIYYGEILAAFRS